MKSEHVLTALLDSVEELSETALGWEMERTNQRVQAVSLDTVGGYVALVGERLSAQVGVAASPAHCQTLCKALLGISAEDPDLEVHELVDAACEIANIVAGGVKGRLANQDAESFRLGLPLFMSGLGHLASGQRMDAVVTRLGSVPAMAVLIHPFIE